MSDDPGSGRWLEIDGLFRRALDRPVEERREFILTEASSDPELREAVFSLLDATDRSHAFLEEPAEVVCELDWEDLAEGLTASARTARDRTVAADDRVGERIGPYRIISRIGRGGMATVYGARREDGQWEQEVALKVMRRGLDTDDIVRRFLSERQILSSLEHANIARLLDGGSTEDGLPYLVMERVDGRPIIAYCDEERLDLPARLKLFCQVLDAAHYAHQNLVVHRDLKPSNILVSGDGTVKLLDFGIARLLDDASGDRTRTGHQLLTPQYASPEQICGDPIGTASDVYQLGILLCVLVAGERPYETAALSPARLERRIVESEPRRPSELVTVEAAGARNSTVERLRRALSGDIDTIALKALRKAPSDRYASAEAFAADLRRHLAGEPISARPATWAYRTRKLVRRNPWLLPVAGFALFALIGYVATLLVHSRDLERERNLARDEALRAQEVQDFLAGVFRSADPYSPADPERGARITVQEALDLGVERAGAELSDRPRIRASLLGAISEVYANLGLLDRALPVGEEALALADEAFGPESREVIAGLLRLGSFRMASDADSAEVLLARGLALAIATLGEQDTTTARAYLWLGRNAERAGRFTDAEESLLAAIRIGTSHEPPPGELVASAYFTLSKTYSRLGEIAAAREAAERALTMSLETRGSSHPQTAIATVGLADALDVEGRDAEAVEVYENAIGRLDLAFGAEHGNTLSARNNLAVTLRDLERYEEAEAVLREVLAVRSRTEGETSRGAAESLQNLAVTVQAQGRLEEAEALLDRSHAAFVASVGGSHPLAAFPLLTRSGIELERGEYERARGSAEAALRILVAALPPGHFATAVGECRLGRALIGVGRREEGGALLEGSVSVLSAAEAAPPAYVAECRQALRALGEGGPNR